MQKMQQNQMVLLLIAVIAVIVVIAAVLMMSGGPQTGPGPQAPASAPPTSGQPAGEQSSAEGEASDEGTSAPADETPSGIPDSTVETDDGSFTGSAGDGSWCAQDAFAEYTGAEGSWSIEVIGIEQRNGMPMCHAVLTVNSGEQGSYTIDYWISEDGETVDYDMGGYNF